jgi:hypothetical protein
MTRLGERVLLQRNGSVFTQAAPSADGSSRGLRRVSPCALRENPASLAFAGKAPAPRVDGCQAARGGGDIG